MSIYIILIIQYLETKFDDIKMKAWLMTTVYWYFVSLTKYSVDEIPVLCMILGKNTVKKMK